MQVRLGISYSSRERLHGIFGCIVSLVFFGIFSASIACGGALQATSGFKNATDSAGLGTKRDWTMGNPICYLDLFLSRHAHGYSLYKNNGDGTFSDMRVLSFCLSNTDLHVGAFADFNNDGYLDLHLVYGARGGYVSGIKRDQHYRFTDSGFHPMFA